MEFTFKDKKAFAVDLLYLFIILYTCLKLSYGASNVVDFVFADESVSLFKGLEFKMGHLFRDGFIYHLWYKLLSVFVPDAISLYYYNYGLLVSLNAFLMYIFLRKTGRGTFFSGLFSILFLISSINVFPWPFITRFAVSVILLTLILVLSVKRHKTKYFTALAGLTVLVYVRPEFILSLVLFSIVSLVLLGYNYYKSSRKVFGYAFLITIVVLLFVSVIKNPSPGQRGVQAFGQHYAFSLKQSGLLRGDPWASGTWKREMMDKFKTDGSLVAAVFNNPREMANHIRRNVEKVPYKTLYAHFPFTLTGYSRGLKLLIKWIIIGLYLFVVVLFIRDIYNRFKVNRKTFLHTYSFDHRLFYFLWLVLFVPSLVSVILIYPRDHYILVLYTFLYLFLLRNLPLIPPNPGRRRYKTYLTAIRPVLLLALVLVIPWRGTGSTGPVPGKRLNGCTTLTLMRQVKAIPVNADVNILGVAMKGKRKDAFFEKYMDSRSQHKYRFFRLNRLPSESFLKENEINMVLIREKRLEKQFPGSDPARWSQTGWTAFELSCKSRLLVKNEILRR